ncbi:hypothetical protein E3N88_28217 [Mikania micrantha]|uniref:NB-ARC domain-containing protein n=1 Tax=Mikania micrantha TaxID=192012 RepID=A0A5N6MZW2_9ASTR|nr:hypothetical protein E3N88_28217 [Mikania micrantha]
MVKCCKKHPLTLSVVGSSLKGKPEFVWKSVMRTLTQAEWVLDNKDSQRRMKLTIKLTIEQLGDEFKKCLRDFEALDEEFKQCLLDLGLFPRNQRISACALLDIWMSLYDHDDMGRDTLIKIFQLADRKFVSSITIGEEANAVVNYCEQTFTTLHDWQRELAIHFSSDEPISQRTRLIIDAQGDDLPAPITQTKEIIRARILSISTGESFSSRWCNMNAPEVEVMVLNIMSETYTLPRFLENMNRLKVLNVTNYGLHTTKFVNFHLFGSLISLTRIRLECVVVSLLSESLLALVNLQKLSFIMCKTDNSFEKRSTYNPNIWPRLVEIEIDSCQDLVVFPELFCNSVHLEKLSINNCNEMIQIPEEFGKLTSLETLSLRSCAKLGKLPCSISRLKKLSVLDMSDCKSLNELPENIGELSGLQMIYMKGCTGIRELPLSVKDLSQLQVFCDEEISYKWLEFLNVKIPVVEEDRLFTLTEKIFNACF